MSDFDNNNQSNNNDSNNGNTDQNQYNKVPEYSFWAEQAPGSSYSNYSTNTDHNPIPDYNTNPNYNNNQYSNPNVNSGENLRDYPDSKEENSGKKKDGSGRKAVKFVAKAICFGLIAAVSFLGFQKIYYRFNPDAPSITIIEDKSGANYEVGYTEESNIKTVAATSISDVTGATLPAIVSINSTSTQTTQWFGQSYDQELQGSGSGIIVGKNEKELLIATNNHVVEGTNKITVTFADGAQAEAITKGTDATADLAVVTVDITKLTDDTLEAITVAKLGNSDSSKVGEMVIAIGNALGYGQSVTVGYISAKDRDVEVSMDIALKQWYSFKPMRQSTQVIVVVL